MGLTPPTLRRTLVLLFRSGLSPTLVARYIFDRMSPFDRPTHIRGSVRLEDIQYFANDHPSV